MKAEILFPEVCNLYGDLQNIYYLKRCCPALEIIETDLHSKPRFLTEDVALVYMGSTTEQGLRLAADALRPYAAVIAARADAGQLILLTGNAPDVFSAAIESDSADTIEGLGILPGRVRYTMMKRHNSFFLGTFDGMEVVGFKSLFGFHYDAAEAEGWFDRAGRGPHTGVEAGGLPPGRAVRHGADRSAADPKSSAVQVAAAADGRRGHPGLRGRGLRQL